MFAPICGWIGMIFILADYFLLANEYISSQNVLYHAINALGSLGLSIDLHRKKAWSALIMQIIFICIALTTITRYVL